MDATTATKQDLLALEERIAARFDAFGEGLIKAFQLAAEHTAKAIEASETRMLEEMHRVEQRLATRIEQAGVTVQKLEVDVASLKRRMDEVERRLTQPQ